MFFLLSILPAYVAAIEYGVDTSFPMHYNAITPDERNPLGYQNRKDFYDHYVAGCLKASEKENELCIWNEEERLQMTLTQPKNMKNFTNAGYAKIKAPPEVTKLLKEYWDDHHEEQEPELWPRGNTYVNHWESQPYVLKMDEEREETLSEMVRPVIEAWTGQNLVSTSVYGIRIYKEGSALAPHVDRLPLVSSCILNVAQDVDEDWPLEVIGHDGKAANVTAHPGDMILYESHSVIHGRPFPLKGRFYASIFVHFEPFGYTKDLMSKDPEAYLDEEELEEVDNIYEERKQAMIVEANEAAQVGNLVLLQKLVKEDPEIVHKADPNGWRPIHEAARSGNTETLKFLVENGSLVDERTNMDTGGSALFLAQESLEEGHPSISYLQSIGAKALHPIESEL